MQRLLEVISILYVVEAGDVELTKRKSGERVAS